MKTLSTPRAAWAALLAVVMIAGCAPGPTPMTPPTDPAPVEGVMTAAQIKACAARGGHPERQGRLQHEMCVIPFADGGKVCRDGSECQGDCETRDTTPGVSTGQCQKSNVRFGCHGKLVNGVARDFICID